LEEKKNNEFVFIVELDNFEKLKLYKDDYPLMELRINIIWFKLYVSYICTLIIKHKAFEAVTLVIIILNSVELCFEGESPLISLLE